MSNQENYGPSDSDSGGGKSRPAHEIRAGRIRATIWKNKGTEGDWYSVNISRSYFEDNVWKTSTSFVISDLLVVAELSKMAWAWINSIGR